MFAPLLSHKTLYASLQKDVLLKQKSKMTNTFGLTEQEEKDFKTLENNLLENLKNLTLSNAKRLLDNVKYRMEEELKLT